MDRAASDIPDLNAAASGSDASGVPVQRSVLTEVKRRARSRQQRRGKPPAWTLWVAKQAVRSQTFFSKTLPDWMMSHREELLSYATSFVFLALSAMVLALWALPPSTTEGLFGLIVTRAEQPNEDLVAVEIEEIVQPDEIRDLKINSNIMALLSNLDEGDTSNDINDPAERDLTMDLEPTDAQMEAVFKQGEFGGRSKAGRRVALLKYGGTAASERAVSMGLEWLQGLQQNDGSWKFSQPGEGAEPGVFQSTEVGATSLALLCFLGAGHTHAQDGPYRDTVHKGLAYIGSQAAIVQGTADLRGASEGNAGMYVQGLATICISEAHAMEPGDTDLEELTKMAVRFIERSQDPKGGGWRYFPRQPGDTSVVGWQVMALQSARAGRIKVSTGTLRSARRFLQSARGDDDGATYRYMPDRGQATNAMSAVALLCRMYLGWQKDHEPLERGVRRLAAVGPSKTDIYFNYYATQVFRHWGGELWDAWNQKMREQLVTTQVTEGPAAGSWEPTDRHGFQAGQIYQTALSILTLEVYYRHLPLYHKLETVAEDDG